MADYIPALGRVSPDQFGMALCTVDGRKALVAAADTPFSIQSISRAGLPSQLVPCVSAWPKNLP